MQEEVRNLALDSNLRGYDLVKLKVSDIADGINVMSRAHEIKQKTNTPVQFSITKGKSKSIQECITEGNLKPSDLPFKSIINYSAHISTRQ